MWIYRGGSLRVLRLGLGKGPPEILGYDLGDVLEVLRRYVSEDEREDGVGGDLPKRSMRAFEGFRAT